MQAPHIALVFLATVAAATEAYRGDGTFIDNGAFEAHYRYVLDLGAIDLTKIEQRTFRLASLPEREFTIGLDVTSTNDSPIRIASVSTKVRLRLENDRKEVVFDVQAPLSQWVLSARVGEDRKGFLYLRGVEEQRPLRDGVTQLERKAVGPDGGWGTYFTPRSSGTYQLVFESEKPITEQYTVHLVALGAGWK